MFLNCCNKVAWRWYWWTETCSTFLYRIKVFCLTVYCVLYISYSKHNGINSHKNYHSIWRLEISNYEGRGFQIWDFRRGGAEVPVLWDMTQCHIPQDGNLEVEFVSECTSQACTIVIFRWCNIIVTKPYKDDQIKKFGMGEACKRNEIRNHRACANH